MEMIASEDIAMVLFHNNFAPSGEQPQQHMSAHKL